MKTIKFKLLIGAILLFVLLFGLVMNNSTYSNKPKRLSAEIYRNFCAGVLENQKVMHQEK